MKVSAIAVCRVSTAEQKLSGSLTRQEKIVLKAAEDLKVKVVRWWSGSVSSKAGTNVTRKDLKEMIEYCKSNKTVKYLIVDEPDRFMRSTDEAPFFEVTFKLIGVRVWYASDPNLNKDDLMSKMLKFTKYLQAESSNEERQRKSINGHIAAINEGRYTFPPKPGYMKGEKPGIHKRHPDTFEPFQTALKEVLGGLYTPSETLKRLKGTKFGKHYARWDMDKFRHFASDPYYAGILEINRQVKVRNEKGLHEAMVTKQEHEQLKTIFMGSYKPRKSGRYYNPEFPMSKLLLCEDCGKKFTGARKSNGLNRKKVHYYWNYRCRGCGKEHNRDKVHQLITNKLKKFEYTGEQESDFTEALETVWKQKQADKLNDIKALKKQLETLKSNKSDLVLELAKADNEIKGDIKEELAKLKIKISDLNQMVDEANKIDEDLVEFVKFGLEYSNKLKDDWWELNFENKQRCQQLLFPGGIFINQDKKVSTKEISSIYRLATNKKDLSMSEKSLMVELAVIATASDG